MDPQFRLQPARLRRNGRDGPPRQLMADRCHLNTRWLPARPALFKLTGIGRQPFCSQIYINAKWCLFPVGLLEFSLSRALCVCELHQDTLLIPVVKSMSFTLMHMRRAVAYFSRIIPWPHETTNCPAFHALLHYLCEWTSTNLSFHPKITRKEMRNYFLFKDLLDIYIFLHLMIIIN